MNRGRSRGAALAVVGLLYLALLAWSGTVLLQSAARRSISVLCSSIDELCREWAQGFTQETGIDVAVVRISTGEALARISRPGGVREFDVWHGGPADSYVLAAERGLLMPYRSPEAAMIPAAYKDPLDHWTGVYLGVLGFCSHTGALKRLGVGLPRSWDDLLDPRLTGQVSVPNPLTSGTGYTTVWTQRLRLGSDEATVAYLTALGQRVLQYTTSGLAPARIAGRGEAAVAVTFSQHCVKAAAGGMADLVVTYPQEGTGLEIGSVALLAGARDVPAAQRYVDYALSREAQRAGWDSDSAQLPTRPDLWSDPTLGGGAPLLDYSPREAAAARAGLVEAVAAVPR